MLQQTQHRRPFAHVEGTQVSVVAFAVDQISKPAEVQLHCGAGGLLVFRVLLRLQGLSGSVGAHVSLTELLQPYLEKMTLDRLNPVSVGRRALRTLRGWERLLATAPANLRPILRQLRDGTSVSNSESTMPMG